MASIASYETYIELEKQFQGYVSFDTLYKSIESIKKTKESTIGLLVLGIQLSLENMESMDKK